MVDRVINPVQVEKVLGFLRNHEPDFDKRIIKHKYYLGTQMGFDPGLQIAQLHYLKFMIDNPWQEGYVDCFFEYFKQGDEVFDADLPKSELEKCVHSTIKQDKALELEFSANRWYLSQKAGKDVGDSVAETDYIKTYLPLWREGYRYFFEENVCPSRNVCPRRYKRLDLTKKDLAFKLQAS